MSEPDAYGYFQRGSELLATRDFHQATVALAATVAAVAGDRARVTTDEGNGHDREEHRECKTEITLHQNLLERTRNANCVQQSRHELTTDPGRPPDRSRLFGSHRGRARPGLLGRLRL
jgi:hypothetical protein